MSKYKSLIPLLILAVVSFFTLGFYLNTSKNIRVLLSNLDNGNLNIKFGKNEFLWIFMAGGQDYKFSLEYRKSN